MKISKKSKNKLFVFSTIKNNFNLLKINHIWLNKFIYKNKFRSFFGFLKSKPFIYKIKYSFLNLYKLNPKPYTLRQIISQTKTKTKESIKIEFLVTRKDELFSKKLLKNLIFKSQTFFKRKEIFSIFKHKIYKYTTAKKRKQHCDFKIINLIDFRQLTSFKQIQKQQFPNVSTISTYNWKTIN